MKITSLGALAMNDTRTVRLYYGLLCIVMLIGVLGVRLAWLQLGGKKPKEQAVYRFAVLQRSDHIVIDSGRGQFVDRHGVSLTGEVVQSLAAFPVSGMPRGTEQEVQQVAEALETSPAELSAWLRAVREPVRWKSQDKAAPAALTDAQVQAVREADLAGVAVLPYRSRYLESDPPIHAIGYISQDPARLARLYGDRLARGLMHATEQLGGAGLEKSLDRLLRGVGPTSVQRVTDAGKRLLEGIGWRMNAPDNPHYPLIVRTTLDAAIQRQAEQALAQAGTRSGAAVVLDAANGDVLAMASLPGFDPLRIGRKGTDERNHALTAYAPGSVFKTVTMAAALESGTATRHARWHCSGIYGRYGLKCWKHGGHGELTLEEAFAKSCNVAFAAMAEKMDPAWLQITAERMGLGRRIGWMTDAFVDGKPLRLLEEEEPGVIFPDKRSAYDGGVRTGTGIGQRDVRVTPLQAANLVVTLLHGGRVAAPRIVSEIRYADGGLMAQFPLQSATSKYGTIQPQTAAAVLKAMRAVVTSGTAKHALASAKWPLAGKSGTAELAGRLQGRNDHWFIGYGPAHGHPRYAVAVLIEQQPGGLRNRAAAVFGDLMERLRALEHRPAAVQEAMAPAVTR